MAKIIKSEIIENLQQAFGCGRDVREKHEWDDGKITIIYYRASDNTNVNEVMLNRVAVLEEERTAHEQLLIDLEAFNTDNDVWLRQNDVDRIITVLQVSYEEAVALKEAANNG